MSFNIADILIQVENLLVQKDFEGCRNVFVQEVFDWSDYYTENCSSSAVSEESITLKYKLIQLWQAYASFEANLKQFKKAVEVYEKAIQDPIVGQSAMMYRLFGEYYVARGKAGNAQKTYITGLTAGLAKEETNWLWCLLQQLIAAATGVAPGFPQLKEDIEKLVPGAQLPELPSQEAINQILGELKATPLLSSQVASDSKLAVPLAVKSLEKTNESLLKKTIDVAETKESEKSHVSIANLTSTTNSVKASGASINNNNINGGQNAANPVHILRPVGITDTGDELDNLCGLSGEQLIRLFHNRPPMLFVAPYREPLKTGPRDLLPDEIQQLENFLGLPLKAMSFPPDPTDLARQKAEFYLDVLEEMWIVQAFKERHFDAWFGSLKKRQNDEKQALLDKLRVTPMPDAAVQLEKKKFFNKCLVQKEMLDALVHKIYYFLLIEQEKILYELQFPRFSLRLLERIQNINNILPANNSKSLFFDDLTVREIASQRRFVGALLHIRLVMKKQFPMQRVIPSHLSGMVQSTEINTVMTSMMPSQEQQHNELGINESTYSNHQDIVQPLMDNNGPPSLTAPPDDTRVVYDEIATPSGSESATKKKRRRISLGSQPNSNNIDYDGALDMFDRQDSSYSQHNSFDVVSPAEMMTFIQEHTDTLFAAHGNGEIEMDDEGGIGRFSGDEDDGNVNEDGNDDQMCGQDDPSVDNNGEY